MDITIIKKILSGNVLFLWFCFLTTVHTSEQQHWLPRNNGGFDINGVSYTTNDHRRKEGFDNLKTQHERYSHKLCRDFFKEHICISCLSDGQHSPARDILQREIVLSQSALSHELTRISLQIISNLSTGNCRHSTRTRTIASARRARRAVAGSDVDTSLFVQSIYEKYATSDVINETDLEKLLKDLGIGQPLDTTNAELQPTHSMTTFDKSVTEQCFLASELVQIFNVSDGIPQWQFASICPSLVQQITQGCVQQGTKATEFDRMMYAWATLAVAAITVFSMLSMIAVPTHGSRFYAAVMQLFVALAVSSLSGDALLHLLPEALGIHGIPVVEGQPNHILIILTVILAVYLFFVFERVMSLCLKGTPYGHGHVHSRPRRETFVEEDQEMTEVIKKVRENHEEENGTRDGEEREDDEESVTSKKENGETPNIHVADKEKKAMSESKKPQPHICGLNMLTVMILVGDVVHNITDGITIGVSFVNGPFAGASTSIAVFFHEVPHEIGDFAVMLRNGVSFRKAMLLSLFSNIIGFVGLYAGLLLGSTNSYQRWIFAATAGMFLYIALVSLVPEMNQQAEEADRRPWRVFLRHNIGLLLGWGVMLGLGVYEQNKENLF